MLLLKVLPSVRRASFSSVTICPVILVVPGMGDKRYIFKVKDGMGY